MALVLTRREWEGFILRLDPATAAILQEMLKRVSDNAKMVSILEALIAFKAEVMVSEIKKSQAKLSFEGFPDFIKIFRDEIDRKMQNERQHNGL